MLLDVVKKYIIMKTNIIIICDIILHLFLKTVTINSTQDLFKRECNHLSTGVILLADIMPGLIIKIFSPFFALHVK